MSQNKTNKEKRKGYRRKMAAALLVGMLAVSTAATGCGKKTVDYDVDGSSSSGNSGTADSGSLQGKYGIPAECDVDIATGDTGIEKISIEDDEVTVPETGDMAIAHYKKKTVGTEEKKQIVEAVFDKDQGIYAYDYEKRTKEDIQREIDMYEREMQNNTDSDMVTYYEEWVNDLKTELQTAPDEYPAAGDYTADAFIGTFNGKQYIISVPADGSTGYYLSSREDTLEYRPMEGANGVYSTSLNDYMEYRTNDEAAADESTNKCTFSEDEAKTIAEDFLAQVGGTDVMLKESSALCWVYYDNNGENLATEVDGYAFKYARAINNQPISSVNVWNVDNFMQDDASVEVPVEEYNISIDSNGVVEARWNDYLEAVGQPETAELLSFDKMLEKANETVPAYFTKYPTRYRKVEFNDITLSYYLKQGANEGEYDYVPAWILSQYEEYTDYSEEDNPSQLVIIDATDGSVIDILELSKSLGTYYDWEETDATVSANGDDDEDTSDEDTSEGDTSEGDTSEGDASEEDTSEGDTSEGDASTEPATTE